MPLAGHDECSKDIPILDKTLTVRDLEALREACSRCVRCLWDGNNYINLLDASGPKILMMVSASL